VLKHEIIGKLDAFIRRYYLNMLIKGSILGVGLLTGMFLLLSFSEFYGHFSTPVRMLFFWTWVFALAAVMWFWIVKPLTGMYRLGKVISYEQAAVIIGNHFEHVRDKLLNLLQMEQMHSVHPESALLIAGIEQKTAELRSISFAGAVNIKANKRYLRFAILPLSLFAVILIFQSSIILDGGLRLLKYNSHFAVQAPFEFVLGNKNLTVERGNNITINLGFKGKSLPADAYMVMNGQRIKMEAVSGGGFAYQVQNIQKNQPFHFEAAGFSSQEFIINTIPVPSVSDVVAEIVYPSYTGRATEKISNTTEFSVPEGSKITWNIRTRDAGTASLISSGQKMELKGNAGVFVYASVFTGSTTLQLALSNGNYKGKDTLKYSVSVVKDAVPVISVEKHDDSANLKQFWFTGQASDDYGITSVRLKYRYTKASDDGKLKKGWQNINVPAQPGRITDFAAGMNMDALGMAAGDEVEYYFEVWDNDAINGFKSGKTPTELLRKQSLEEVRKDAAISGSKVSNMMQEAFNSRQQMQKEAESLRNSLSGKKNMNWEDRQRIEDFIRKQDKLTEKVEELKKEKEKLDKQQNEFQSPKESIQEKKEQLDNLLKDLQNPETQKLLEELRKLLDEKASKEKIAEKLQQMQQQNKDQARDINQLMEQFKELQLEKKLNDNIDRLEKLAKEQEKLADKTEGQKGDKTGELKEAQEKLKEEMNNIRKELKEAEGMNKDLEKPMNLDMGEQEQQNAEEQQKEAGNNLDKGKNQKASENQKSAAEQMKKAAEKMKKSLEQEQQKRLSEDYQKLRELLENLVEASFEQETVFTELSKVREYNPKFVDLNKRQMKVKEKCLLLEDSLRALAKRQPMVGTFVTKEIARINNNMELALNGLKVRKLTEAVVREQYVMTGLNNLSVLLLESMQNMQQKMSQNQSKSGKQSCNNPGAKGKSQGQPKKGDKLSKSQEQLGQMLQEMQKKSQQGKPGQQGQPKPGEKGSDKETNREYARIALMQEALRKQLADLRKQLEKQGNGAGAKELQNTEKLMEQQEKDLVNKVLPNDLLMRQKQIETRLLEHEKSDRNQQTEEKREANSPLNTVPSIPSALQEYMKTKKREREGLQFNPPELNPYFREKVKEYLQKVN
jgi:hypothetical protein